MTIDVSGCLLQASALSPGQESDGLNGDFVGHVILAGDGLVGQDYGAAEANCSGAPAMTGTAALGGESAVACHLGTGSWSPGAGGSSQPASCVSLQDCGNKIAQNSRDSFLTVLGIRNLKSRCPLGCFRLFL